MERKTIESVQAGDVIETKINVGKYQPVYYAGASGDFNPIHIDNDFAKMVGLGGTILHGLCTMAFCARMFTDWAQDPGALKKIKVRFASPVRPDDTIKIQGAVTEINGNLVDTMFNAVNQDGTEVITMAKATVELG